MRRILLVLAVVLVPAAMASAQTRGVVPEDFYDEVAVEDVAVSPDGTLLAFTVTTVVEKENERRREVWVQRLSEGQPEGDPFRFTDPTEDSSSPVWSPGSTRLAFTSRRGDDPNRVWFARVTAPGGEAFHIDGVEDTPV